MRRAIIYRTLSFVLLFAMLFTQTTVFAASPNFVDSEKLTVIIQNDDNTMEISQLDGVYMYFHDTEDYTISINIYPNNRTEIAKYDKTTGSLAQAVENTIRSIENDDDISDTFYMLEEKVKLSTIALTYEASDKIYKISEGSSAINSTNDSEADIAQKIDDALIEIFGEPYSLKNLNHALYSQGYVARLYGEMHFERYKYTSWFISSGSTLAAVAGLIGLPASDVLKIITFVGTAITGYSVYSDLTSNKYVANVHNNKLVKVNDTYPYRAGRSEYGYCYVGDIRAAYVSRNKVRADYDYDDDSALLATGINNYINYSM